MRSCPVCTVRVAVGLVVGLMPCLPAGGMEVYRQDFDALAPGPTQSPPGAPGQDGWFVGYHPGEARAEIQSTIALGTQALWQIAPVSNPSGAQTIDQRPLTDPDLSAHPIVSLEFDAWFRTSNPDAVNIYGAHISVWDTEHPGYWMIGANFGAGNGPPKSQTLVFLSFAEFNGIDNNVVFIPAAGRNLAWETWHHVRVTLDRANDRYLLLEVDGQLEDLSAHRLPRSGAWELGNTLDRLQVEIVPNDWGNPPDQTDDEVVWDNIVVTAVPGPEPIVDRFLSIEQQVGGIELVWQTLADPGTWQAVQAASSRAAPDWFVVHVHEVVGATNSWTDAEGLSAAQRFYRVGPPPEPTVIFADDMEGGPNGWTHGGVNDVWNWGTPSNGPGAAHGGSGAWATTLSGDYLSDARAWLRSPVIDLGGVDVATLVFWDWRQVEEIFDFVFLDVLNDEGDAVGTLIALGESELSWTERTFDLTPWARQPIRLEFRLESDDSVVYPGWYLDDLTVSGL